MSANLLWTDCTTHWPRLVLFGAAGQATDVQIDTALRETEALLGMRKRFFAAFCLETSLRVSAIQRRTLATGFAKLNLPATQFVIGSAVITTSMLARGIVQALNWYNPVAHQQLAFNSVVASLSFTNRLLAGDGYIPFTLEEAKSIDESLARNMRE